MTDEVIERGEEREVLSTLMHRGARRRHSDKLLLDGTHLDFARSTSRGRSAGDRLDSVRERTCGSPYARAFFTLVEELGIVERTAVG